MNINSIKHQKQQIVWTNCPPVWYISLKKHTEFYFPPPFMDDEPPLLGSMKDEMGSIEKRKTHVIMNSKPVGLRLVLLIGGRGLNLGEDTIGHHSRRYPL